MGTPLPPQLPWGGYNGFRNSIKLPKLESFYNLSDETSSESSVEPEDPGIYPWKVGRINRSNHFNQFRNKAIAKMNIRDELLSRSELLASDHIYCFDAAQLDDDTLTSMKEDLDHNGGYVPLCSDTKQCCDFEEAMQDGDYALVEKLLRTKYKQTGQVKTVLQIIENLYRTFSNTNVLAIDEDRFGDVVFKPTFGEIARNVSYAQLA
ncbi:hypothetical protein K492DRAFT_193163 [Lichtheimia hyalospora FSU 10163]|nr:hypothetical protein K492DRAFT_193163 [Lichtheimia hyalospora FSU 10163]